MKDQQFYLPVSVAYIIHSISRLELVTKVSRKRDFIFILCLFLGGTSSKQKKMVNSLEQGVKILHCIFYHAELYQDITCSGLLINKTEEATGTKKSQKF